MKEASKRAHVQASGMNFDHRMAHLYMSLLKKAINGRSMERDMS